MKKNKNINFNTCKYIIRSVIIIIVVSFFVYHILKKPTPNANKPTEPESTIVKKIGLSYISNQYDLEFNSERFEKDLKTIGFSKAVFAVDDNKISYYRQINGSPYTEYISWNIISEATSNINSIALYYYISDTTVLQSEQQVNLKDIKTNKEETSTDTQTADTITDTSKDIEKEVTDAIKENPDVTKNTVDEKNINVSLNIANTAYDSDNNKIRETFIIREANQLENTNNDNATLIMQNNLNPSSYISILDSISNLKPLNIENSMNINTDDATKKYELFIGYYSEFLKQVEEIEGKENQIENTSLQKTTVTEDETNDDNNTKEDETPVTVTIEEQNPATEANPSKTESAN